MNCKTHNLHKNINSSLSTLSGANSGFKNIRIEVGKFLQKDKNPVI